MEEGLKGKPLASIPPSCCRPGRLPDWMTSLRSCLIGCWMGITPAGATPASFMSYGIAKRASSKGDEFGKGRDRGRDRAGDRRPAVARGAAAHAVARRTGFPTAAVLLGGLLIWGLQPGPLLFVEQKDFVWT